MQNQNISLLLMECLVEYLHAAATLSVVSTSAWCSSVTIHIQFITQQIIKNMGLCCLVSKRWSWDRRQT